MTVILRIYTLFLVLAVLQIASAAPRPSATTSAPSASKTGATCAAENVRCCAQLEPASDASFLLELFHVDVQDPNHTLIGITCNELNARNPSWYVSACAIGLSS